MRILQSKTLLIELILLIATLLNVELKSIDSSTHHNLMKRQEAKKLMPTLTVDVGPQSSSIPSLLIQENTVDYYFTEGAALFNFSCVIKHPSYRYKIQITREQELNSGIKSEPIDLIDPADMEQVNPVVRDERISIVFDDTVTSPSEPGARFLRASFLIRNLKLKDSGIYKCMYSSLVKQIKVVVFKQVHANNVKFPLVNYKSLELNKPTEFTCSVNDVYPKPVITFISPSDSVIESDSVTVQDTSDKTDPVYAYSSLNTLNYTPRYTDNNKNITCSVLSVGSSNFTITNSYKLNIEGTEIVTEECKDTVHASADEVNFQIVCVFFSNPRLEPEWETKVFKTSTVVVDSAATIETGIVGSQDGTTTEPSNNLVTQTEELLKIPQVDDETTNYVASVEERESGVYRAIIRIKVVREEDYKNYTLKISNGNQVQIEQSIRLRKTSEYQNQKDTIIGHSSVSGSGADYLMPNSKFLILFLQSAILAILFNR